MNPPGLATRIKQWRRFSRVRIYGSLSRTLTQRAGNASQSEVFDVRFPAGFARFYMVNMEDCLLASLSEPAVFAPTPSPLRNFAPQMRGHTHMVTLPGDACAQHASEARREPRSNRPSPRPRFFQPHSRPAPGPVYPGAFEAVFGLPWEAETAPGHQASLLQFGRLEA